MKYLKLKLLQFLTRNLLKTVDEDDILQVTNKGYVLRRRRLSPEEVENIKDEAKAILESEVWQLAKRELEWVAFVKGRKATTIEDQFATHYLFYNIDVIDNFLKRLSQ